jgi:ribosomal protein L7/L12
MHACPFCQHENASAADRCASCGAALTTIAESRDDDDHSALQPEHNAQQSLEAEIKNFLGSRGKIEAIKHYRERTGAGLVEAKQAVESIEAGSYDPSAFSGATKGELADQLDPLLRAGNVIGAIKLYRERTGVGLKQAKDDVEALARQRSIPLKQVGCGTSVFLLLAIAIGISVFLALLVPAWF